MDTRCSLSTSCYNTSSNGYNLTQSYPFQIRFRPERSRIAYVSPFDYSPRLFESLGLGLLALRVIRHWDHNTQEVLRS